MPPVRHAATGRCRVAVCWRRSQVDGQEYAKIDRVDLEDPQHRQENGPRMRMMGDRFHKSAKDQDRGHHQYESDRGRSRSRPVMALTTSCGTCSTVRIQPKDRGGRDDDEDGTGHFRRVAQEAETLASVSWR